MPQFPKDELAQLIIASCIANDIGHVVISPGSRNAPLTIGFFNHHAIETYSIVDERCAAFFALGIAQQIQKPVAVLCTSGSALLNYYPAVSEAFYSQIPLVVISADRPKNKIDIGDGQTIRQENVFENHILFSANLKKEADDTKELLNRAFKEVIKCKGPVHINVPFEEPLYDVVDDLLKLESLKMDTPENPLDVNELQKFATIWNASSKKMILVGSHFPDELLQIQMNKIAADDSVIVLTETTSNLCNAKFINSIDKVLFPLDEIALEQFQPEIVVTLGGMIVSKKVKQFLRKFKPKQHWHVDRYRAYNTFYSLSQHFEISPQLFFSQFFFLTKNKESDFQKSWLTVKESRVLKHKSILKNCEYSDLKVFESILEAIPKKSQLQLSNSSIIRYSQLFDLQEGIDVFCNRGTSGIDGSTSTAIGAAMIPEKRTTLVTGDISFYYDSNALWNNHVKSDFRIIILNNGGGGIFKFIPGPKESNALPYFETPHGLTANHLAAMFNYEYSSASSMGGVRSALEVFYQESEQPRILEIFTPSDKNDLILKAYFKALK